ncbi:MAG: GDSL-type esterase/lipase family protein [Coriobacteriia bacterium]|nr:GDSL-type esterase/lipase family protein [Coriobacteriia bacterium]
MRILLLGNSLTTSNDLPHLLADSLQAEIAVHARGGARLSEHLNPNTKLGAKTQQALASGGWDFVVLQEMSNGPLRFRTRYGETVDQLAGQIKAAGATPVIYATWAYAPTCPKLEKLGVSADEMHAAMHEAFAETAQRADARLADACLAFHEHDDRLALYALDGVHPSPAGTQVALSCLVHAMADNQLTQPKGTVPFGSRPYTVYLLECEDGSYYAGITTDMERRLQEHLSRGPKSAKYTRTHPMKRVAATWEAADRAQASRLEYRLKQLTHEQKETLVQHPELVVGDEIPF